MKMNLFCDQEGYIYFNELFYYLMKATQSKKIKTTIRDTESIEDFIKREQEAKKILDKEEKYVLKKISQIKKNVGRARALPSSSIQFSSI